MKKVILSAVTIAAMLGMSGCTDATMGKFASYGGSASIICYSANTVIFKGTSTGKVKSEASSDGYFFIDAADNKLKEVSGNCVIEYQTY